MEEQSAALLDLSLPISPKQETGEQVFTLATDLAGLDLSPESNLQKSKRLTSIEELLLNEQLVVNCSTWMDNELADLGSGDDTGANLRPSTPRSANNKTVELQLQELGLDVSKTTLPKTSKSELSLSTRSVLGRLPDLSFMLLTDRVEDRTNFSRGYLHN